MPRKTLGSLMDGSRPSDRPSSEMDIEHRTTHYNFERLTPKRVKYIIQKADAHGDIDRLYKLYDDMEVSDTRYSGILNQLRSTLTGMPLRVIPAEGRSEAEREKAEEFATYAREVLTKLDTRSLTKEFMEPYIRGAVLFNLEWELEDLPYSRQMYFPKEVEPVDGKYLKVNQDASEENFGGLKVQLKNKDLTDISEIPETSRLFLENGKGKHDYTHMGIARKVLPWWISTRFVQTWWVQYIENYGQPTRIGKYPRGASKKKRFKMRKFLNKVGKNGYGLFPHGMEVELKETKESGQISTHKEFLNKAHEEYQIHILGQAGTTGENAEGYASTSVLNGIRMDIIENVGQLSGKGYEKLVDKGLNVNYGDEYEPHLAPTIKPIYLNSADAKKMAQAAEILNNKMGLSIPERHLYEQVLGIEKPEDGTMVLMNGEIVEKSEAEEMTPSSQQQNEQVAQSTREADETGDTSIANDGRN